MLHHVSPGGKDAALFHPGLAADGPIIQQFVYLLRQAGRQDGEVVVHIEMAQLLIIPGLCNHMAAIHAVGQVDQAVQRQLLHTLVQIHVDKALKGGVLPGCQVCQLTGQQIQLRQLHILRQMLCQVVPAAVVRNLHIERLTGIHLQQEAIQLFLLHGKIRQPAQRAVHVQRAYIYRKGFLQSDHSWF